MTTTKLSYVPDEAVVLRLMISNVGDQVIQFTDTKTGNPHNNQFAFTAYEQFAETMLPDIGNPDNSGLGLAGDVRLEPGQIFETTIDVGPWFQFKEPGDYIIRGSYRMDLGEWEEFATGECEVIIKRPSADK